MRPNFMPFSRVPFFFLLREVPFGFPLFVNSYSRSNPGANPPSDRQYSHLSGGQSDNSSADRRKWGRCHRPVKYKHEGPEWKNPQNAYIQTMNQCSGNRGAHQSHQCPTQCHINARHSSPYTINKPKIGRTQQTHPSVQSNDNEDVPNHSSLRFKDRAVGFFSFCTQTVSPFALSYAINFHTLHRLPGALSLGLRESPNLVAVPYSVDSRVRYLIAPAIQPTDRTCRLRARSIARVPQLAARLPVVRTQDIHEQSYPSRWNRRTCRYSLRGSPREQYPKIKGVRTLFLWLSLPCAAGRGRGGCWLGRDAPPSA